MGGERGGYKNLPWIGKRGGLCQFFLEINENLLIQRPETKITMGQNIMVQVIEILKKEKADARFKYGGLFYPHKMGKLLKM